MVTIKTLIMSVAIIKTRFYVLWKFPTYLSPFSRLCFQFSIANHTFRPVPSKAAGVAVLLKKITVYGTRMSVPYCQGLPTGLQSDPNFSNTHPCNPFNDHPLQNKEMSARVTLRCMHLPYFPMSNVNMHLFKKSAKVLSLHDVGLYSVSSQGLYSGSSKP